MKKIIVLILTLTLCIMAFGCSSQSQSNNKNNTIQNNQEQKESDEEESNDKSSDDDESNDKTSNDNESTKEATLFINMEGGSEIASYKEYPFEYSGELTAEMLADGLSDLTGLDFSITSSTISDGLIIDWSDNSTLIAGLGNREQKEEFLLLDNDSLTWMMLDSLWITLRENLNVENIYYSMFGGSDLWFEALYPVNVFPLDTPYMGSAFYFAHSDVVGDVDDYTNIPLIIANNITLSDPPEGELSCNEAYEILSEKVLAYEQIESFDENNLSFLYQGIMVYQGVEYYTLSLCEYYSSDDFEILYAYLVDGQGNVLKGTPYGNSTVWDPIW
ncbi:hypothetical protein [Clostridium sp. DL1XJH146]